jgi:NADH:ubiquinone oxidoreductase subunit 2 (subunit N)
LARLPAFWRCGARKTAWSKQIDDLAGLSSTNPFMALMLTVLMFSLAGIPPLVGFFGKWFVFVAAIEAGLYALAIIGVLASVVGAYYYLRIIKVMFFDEPAEAFQPMPMELKVRPRPVRRVRDLLLRSCLALCVWSGLCSGIPETSGSGLAFKRQGEGGEVGPGPLRRAISLRVSC